MFRLLRPLLYALPPERAHGLALGALAAAARLPGGEALLRALYAPRKARPVTLWGLQFPNAVGLAAGYDKDGRAWQALGALGFGHVELGTVTPRPQPGNPAPRVFRLTQDQALINRMGFPSGGAERLEERLRAPRPPGLIVGVNLGKNKDTPLEDAAQDYQALLARFAPLADYLVVNVSSPNTPDLRRLQSGPALAALLGGLVRARDAQAPRRVPLLVKLAPDLSEAELVDALDAALGAGVDGLVATNTTLRREGLRSAAAGEAGGLSGAPLREPSRTLLRQAVRHLDGRLPVVSAGGIDSPEEARVRLDLGASLVQLWTGLVYQGPGLVRRVVEGLAG